MKEIPMSSIILSREMVTQLASQNNETDTYINKFNLLHNKSSISKWMHDHPTSLKIIQISSFIFGVALLSTIPLTLPLIGTTLVIGIGVTGGLALLTSSISWLFLQYVTCKKNNIINHVFQEGEFQGSRLYYRGHIPILEMDDTNPKNAGFAHGYLLGKNIQKVKSNFNLIFHSLLRHKKANELQQMLERIQKELPEHLKIELEGLVKGYNKWAEETFHEDRMTFNDALLMHLIPDSKHFIPEQIENDLTGTVACTSILYKNQEDIIFGRNMDWCPFGEGGSNSIIMVWRSKGIASLGTPGLMGVVTGWNKENLCLAMNVCPGKTSSVRGIPAIFFNRVILENARSLKEADIQIEKHRPLGPYHMTLADKYGQGGCFSFYQDKNENSQEKDYRRYAEIDKPLLVVNWRYPECQGGSFNSEGRTTLLNTYFNEAIKEIPQDKLERAKLVDNALQLTPLVNSWITMHSFLFNPQKGTVKLSWDNGYAASSQDKHELNLQEIITSK